MLRLYTQLSTKGVGTTLFLRKVKDSNLWNTFRAFVCFQDKCNRPLCQPSIETENILRRIRTETSLLL